MRLRLRHVVTRGVLEPDARRHVSTSHPGAFI
jgi:hypothetical protein